MKERLDLEQLYHLVDLLNLDNLSVSKQKLREETRQMSVKYNTELIAILQEEIDRREA